MPDDIAKIAGALTKARIHRKADGLLMVKRDGSARFMSLWEAVKYRLFGTIPAFLSEADNG